MTLFLFHLKFPVVRHAFGGMLHCHWQTVIAILPLENFGKGFSWTDGRDLNKVQIQLTQPPGFVPYGHCFSKETVLLMSCNDFGF